MIATIITDASVSTEGVAGWAGRTIYNNERKTYSGRLKDIVGSSNDAELAALVNTVVLSFKGFIPPYQSLLMQTDNYHVVRLITATYIDTKIPLPKMSDYQYRCLRVLDESLRAGRPIDVRIKHVKAHLRYDQRGKRHHVQQEMDRLARQERLRYERSKIG